MHIQHLFFLSLSVDGPFLDTFAVPTVAAARLNDSLTLECGRNLMSSPAPVVTWMDPSGEVVMEGDDRLSIITDSSGVRLVFAATTTEDNGTWTCVVTVEGVNITRPRGVMAPRFIVGNISNSIELTIVGEV